MDSADKEQTMRHGMLAGLAMLVVTCAAQARIVTRPVTYTADDVTLKGHLVYDDAIRGRQPGVLVFPEWWGLDEFPQQKAEQLAKMGYVALAADMYGEGRVTNDPQEASKLAGGLAPEQLRKRARAALETLRRQEGVDGSRIAAIGFCFGGKVAFQLAYSGADIKAAVSFHGDLGPPSTEEAKGIKAHLLALTGGADPMVPPEKVQKFWQALEGTGVVWQINVYSGAKHSFTNPAADRRNMPPVGYHPLAAQRSWEAMQQLFQNVFQQDTAHTRPATRAATD